MYLKLSDNKEIYIRVIGRGRPVILLHGIFMNSVHWLPFVLPLSCKYKFIIPDMRGHGKSHNVPFSMDHAIENYARDLREIIEHFNYHKYKLVGLSMGGLMSWQYLRQYNMDRIDKYLNIDQGIRFFNREDWKYGFAGSFQQEFFESVDLMMKETVHHRHKPFSKLPKKTKQLFDKNFADFIGLAFPQSLFRNLLKTFLHSFQGARLTIPLSSWHHYMKCILAYMQDFNFTEDLKKMTIPTSLFVGMKSDMYPPKGQQYIATVLKNHDVPVDLVKFHHSGHALMMTEPVKFTNEVNKFLMNI